MKLLFMRQCVHRSLPVTNDNDEKMTTKNDVEYFSAFAKCGNASRVSRYRRIHCANRNQAGSMATIGRIKYEPSTHDSTSISRNSNMN